MTMFGHLKAEEFTNLLDGAKLDDRLHTHLRNCAQCLKTFESIQEVRHKIEEMRSESLEFIPEPEWSEFRSDVRNALLSRSVKRQNAGRGWFRGFGWQPAMAWGVSMLLVVGLLGVIWNQRRSQPEATQTTATESTYPEDFELNSIAAMSQPDIFDDLVNLTADDAENLQMILDDMAQEGVTQQ